MEYKSLETILFTLANSPKECVYSLVNEKDRKVQVFSTSNFISSVCRLVQDLGNYNNEELLKDLNNIKVCILETEFNSKESRNNSYKRIVARYKTQGYEFYNELVVVQYRLKESFQYKGGKPYYVYELVSHKGSKAIVVGVFSKYREARSWSEGHYPNGTIPKVVIAENIETKTWSE